MEERLQKIMAQAGLGSRRVCETFIADGRVKVNGITATLGSKADPEHDHITVDGSAIAKPAAKIYIALHKPRGVLSTVEAPDPRPTVRDLIPVQGTFYPVGRLDVESEGLILLTNDGELANQLTHPRYGHEKEYRVLVSRVPDQDQLSAWRYGVILEDEYKTAPAEVEIETVAGKGAWLRVILREGRKRQIREMGMRTGLPVIRIVRIRIGTLQLGRMRANEWRYLTPREVADLRKRPLSKRAPRRAAAPAQAGTSSTVRRRTSPDSNSRRSPSDSNSRPPRERQTGSGGRSQGSRSDARTDSGSRSDSRSDSGPRSSSRSSSRSSARPGDRPSGRPAPGGRSRPSSGANASRSRSGSPAGSPAGSGGSRPAPSGRRRTKPQR